MRKRRIESHPCGLFPQASEKSLEDNLFYLLSLYDTLITQAIKRLPDEHREEFVAAHQMINTQRKAYKHNAKEE